MPSQVERAQLNFRRTLADAFTFVRSREANRAIATVTVEQLAVEQIARNGETDLSQANTNNQEYDPTAAVPASTDPINTVSFVSGSDINLPSKVDRIRALRDQLVQSLRVVRSIDPELLIDDLQQAVENDDPITTAQQFEQRSTE